jgi:hypothetical protein
MFDLCHSGVMVGRFNVRPGDGPRHWLVWDNAMNGRRGEEPTAARAQALAADLELQYDAHGPRDPRSVRRPDKPVTVDAWQPRVGELDAWVSEGGEWIGRVKLPDGQIKWISQRELRPAEGSSQVGRSPAGGAS